MLPHAQSRQADSLFKVPAGFSIKSPPGVKTRSRRSSVYFMNGETIIEKVVKHTRRQSPSGRRKTIAQDSFISAEPKRKPGRSAKTKESLSQSKKKSPPKNQPSKAKKSSPARRQTRIKQTERPAASSVGVRGTKVTAGGSDSSVKNATRGSAAGVSTSSPKATKTKGGASLKRRVSPVVKSSPSKVSSATKTPVNDVTPEPRTGKKGGKSTTKSKSAKTLKNGMSTREMSSLLDESLTWTRQPPTSARRSSRKQPAAEEKSLQVSGEKSLKKHLGSKFTPASPSPSFQNMKKRLSAQFVNAETPTQTPEKPSELVKDASTSTSGKALFVKTPAKRAAKRAHASPAKMDTPTGVSSAKRPKINVFADKKSSTPVQKETKKPPAPSSAKTPRTKSLAGKGGLPLTPKSSVSKKFVPVSRSLSSRKSLSSQKPDSDLLDISFEVLPKPKRSASLSRKSEKLTTPKPVKHTQSQSKLKSAKSPLPSTESPVKHFKLLPNSTYKDANSSALRHETPSHMEKKKIAQLKTFPDMTPTSKFTSPAKHSTPKVSNKLLSLQQKHKEATARLQQLRKSSGRSLQCRDKNIEKLKLSAAETLLKQHASVFNTEVNTRSVASLSSRKRKQSMTSSSTTESNSKRRRHRHTGHRQDSPMVASSAFQDPSLACLNQRAKKKQRDDSEDKTDSRLSYVRSVSVEMEQEGGSEDRDRTTAKSRTWCSVM